MLHIVCSKFIFTGIKAFFSPGRKFIFKLFEVKCGFMINLQLQISGVGIYIQLGDLGSRRKWVN